MGERYSLVYFINTQSDSLSAEDVAFFVERQVPWPSDGVGDAKEDHIVKRTTLDTNEIHTAAGSDSTKCKRTKGALTPKSLRCLYQQYSGFAALSARCAGSALKLRPQYNSD